MRLQARRKASRPAAAAVEFAFCLVFIMLPILAGLWEIGRIVEVQQVVYNAAREGARSASMATEYLDPGVGGINPGSGPPNVANDVLTYLQSAEPQAFVSGHAVSWSVTTAHVPAGGVGYTCTDTTANRELFTITYLDVTSNSTKDPYNANKLDTFQLGIQVPYQSIAVSPLPRFFSGSRLYAVVAWTCLKDSPFQVSPVLPAP